MASDFLADSDEEEHTSTLVRRGSGGQSGRSSSASGRVGTSAATSAGKAKVTGGVSVARGDGAGRGQLYRKGPSNPTLARAGRRPPPSKLSLVAFVKERGEGVGASMGEILKLWPSEVSLPDGKMAAKAVEKLIAELTSDYTLYIDGDHYKVL